MKNQRGFTLIEAVISLGLMAFVAMVTSQILTQQNKSVRQIRDEMQTSIESMFADNVMFTDLKNADPSYNLVQVKDDTGQGFFDYIPDVADAMIAQKTRTLTLKLGGTTDFYMLETDTTAGLTIVYDPVLAYTVGAPPANPNIPATLTYVGINNNNAVSGQRPLFWNDGNNTATGRLLMLDTNARLRPVFGATTNLMVPPRSPAFVGSVQGNDLVASPVVNKVLNTLDPVTNQPITTADYFLRTVPDVGGGAPMVRLRPVSFVHYFLRPQPNLNDGTAQFFKEVFKDGAYQSTPFLIADHVVSMQFARPTITGKVINFSMIKLTDL